MYFYKSTNFLSNLRHYPVLILILALAACSGFPAPAAPTPTPSPSPEPGPPLPAQTASPSPAPPLIPAPTATPAALLPPGYTLTADFDYAAHTLSVLEQIVYANRSGEPLQELLLVADALSFPGSIDLTALKSSAGPGVKETTWENTWLHVHLESALSPGQSITLNAAYTLNLPGRTADPGLRPMVIGWSARQTNLVDWYLYLPPYQAGQGWLAHKPGFYGEHQVYEASDFQVNLRVLNAPQGLSTATSAPEQIDGEWRRYELKQARSFAISLSSNYKVSTTQIGEVTVSSYYFTTDAGAGQAALKTAAQALELYSRLFGAYPHAGLAVVEADFLDGMEYDGLIFLSNGFYNLYHGTPGEYLVAIAAHETAHQWWYGLVGSDQALEPWLDEALSTYSERIYYENLAPEALNWWWEVRVKYYNPRGFVDDSIYNPHKETQAYRAYRDAVYLNGALFLENLRGQMGDEAFFAFLKDYATRYRWQLASGADFFAVLREHSSVDITPLLKKYFANPP